MAVKHNVIECRESKDDKHLNVIIRVLETIEQRQCMMGPDRLILCEKIVSYLGRINISSTDAQEYAKVMPEVAKIQEALIKSLVDEDMVNNTLHAMYNDIANPHKNPSPMTSLVLQLIEEAYIPKAVQWILQSGYTEGNLEQALMTLCTWLSKWTLSPNLGPLVLEFMRGLEAQQHYEILIEVTLVHIKKLFKLLIIPDIRKSVGPVVFHMLKYMHNSSEAFLLIVPRIPIVLESLHKENTETSRYCLQNIVNISVELIDRFPEHKDYETLRRVLKPYSASIDNKKSPVACKSWLESSQAVVQMQYSLGKVGLNNLGNTCYMNSVIQALFMAKTFRNDVLLSHCESLPLFSKLQTLFALLQFSKRMSLSPGDISSMARPPGFQPGHQHDSSEFLGYLLDVLHEQENSMQQSTSSGTDKSPTGATTVVKKAFAGKALSQSQCSTCEARSERVDTFRDLQLSFPSNTDNQSVQTLIDYYLQPEKLSGDNQYHCDACRGLTDGERVTKIIEPPLRLVLTLKHFRYDPATQLRTKLMQRIELDSDIVLENTQYTLYAAVVHCGSSVDSGHYYTYARDHSDWYKFNDCYVTKSKADELFGLRPPEAPYILFYQRKDYDDPEPLNKCDLSVRLQALIVKDFAELDAEKKRTQISFPRNRPNKKEDPPPPGCGGGGFIDSSHNRFVC